MGYVSVDANGSIIVRDESQEANQVQGRGTWSSPAGVDNAASFEIHDARGYLSFEFTIAHEK